MKVCLVGPAYPYRGGIAHFNTLLAREFQVDHEILLINFKRLYPSIFFPGKTQFDTSASPIAIDSERVIDSVNPLTFFRTARLMARFEPQLVVFQWWHPFFAFAYAGIRFFLRRLLKCKIVYLCHNVLPHESSFVDRILIRIGFAGVNAFMTQSSEDERKLVSLKRGAAGMPGILTAVHPHPIYDVFRRGKLTKEQAREKLGIDDRLILFFGYIRHYKGLGILLEAFAKALASVEMKLLIVGEFYEDRRTYDSLIEKMGISRSITIIGEYVPNEEVEIYFEAADVVVLPYLSATQSGIVQVAYAFDKPVIVTSVGGLPDVVEEGRTGLIVAPGDPAGLAEALIKFFRENMAEEMEKAVAEMKDRFSWKKCKDVIIELVTPNQAC